MPKPPPSVPSELIEQNIYLKVDKEKHYEARQTRRGPHLHSEEIRRDDLIPMSPKKIFQLVLRFRSGAGSMLIVSKSKTSPTDLLPENTIFLNKVFNDLLLPLVQPTSDGNHEK
jgi:hypothetical protein